jgi:hypothetical protein
MQLFFADLDDRDSGLKLRSMTAFGPVWFSPNCFSCFPS